jgi:hypothetical protein
MDVPLEQNQGLIQRPVSVLLSTTRKRKQGSRIVVSNARQTVRNVMPLDARSAKPPSLETHLGLVRPAEQGAMIVRLLAARPAQTKRTTTMELARRALIPTVRPANLTNVASVSTPTKQ